LGKFYSALLKGRDKKTTEGKGKGGKRWQVAATQKKESQREKGGADNDFQYKKQFVFEERGSEEKKKLTGEKKGGRGCTYAGKE